MALTLRRGRQTAVETFTPEDLRRERAALEADQAALADAEGAVKTIEAELGAVDPELDAEGWHRARAEQDERLRFAIRERDRLTASVDHRRERCRWIVHALHANTINPVEAEADAESERMRELAAAMAALERRRVEREAVLDRLRDERDEAAAEFVDSQTRIARERSAQAWRDEARRIREQQAMGFDPPVPPGARRYLREPDRSQQHAQQVYELTRGVYPHQEARQAGVARIGEAGLAPFEDDGRPGT